ncbi:MAG TPA: DUF1330 domain-containing protein [Candidatus Sulfotelmatobacter sp.]|nr:DUF1330 domain-containing protein [Candidatus Sulfotelmatobacter sp.]
MKSNYKVLIGVVAGILAGAVGNSAIHGQQVKTPPVYLISEADAITDPTAIKEYAAKVNETLAPFNGHYHFVVRGGKTESLDGDAPPKGIVVIAFDSSERAHAWYDSPAYAAIRPIRQAATKGRMYIVEGVAIQ